MQILFYLKQYLNSVEFASKRKRRALELFKKNLHCTVKRSDGFIIVLSEIFYEVMYIGEMCPN